MPYNNYLKYIKEKYCVLLIIYKLEKSNAITSCLDDNLKSFQLCIFEVNTNQCYELTKKNRLSFCHLYV
jgi:hypothetical protein